jgi:hypothetical protein
LGIAGVVDGYPVYMTSRAGAGLKDKEERDEKR